MAEAEPWDAYSGEPWEAYAQTAAPKKPHKEDIWRAMASRAKRSFIGLPGMVGDLENLWGQAVEKGFRALPESWIRSGGGDPQAVKASPLTDYAAMNDHITSGQANQAWDKITGDKPYEAQTQGERYAGAIGAMAPAAIGAGPGNILPTMGAMIGGGLGSEFAADQAQQQAPDWENEARVMGGMLGGGGGFVSGRAIGTTASNLELNPSSVGMFGGNIRRKTPGLPPVAVNKTLAERAGYLGPDGVEKFDAWHSPYAETGHSPFMFQAYQEPGVSKAASITRQPGETPQIARDKIEGPITGDKTRTGARYQMQSRALKAADEMTGAPAELDAQYTAAQKAYDGVLNDAAVSPTLKVRADDIIDRIDPKDHQWITDEVGRLARADGIKELNQAQQYQYAKSAIYHYAKDLADKPKTAMRGAKYMQVFKDLQSALHDPADGIPGYKKVDDQYADVVTRKQAAEKLRDKITHKPEGHAPGTIAMNPATMDELSSTFGQDKAGGFILNQRVLGQDAREYNRVVPWSGSPTVAHLGEQVDSAAMIADALKSGRPVESALRGFGHFVDKRLGGMQEKGRNALGEHLLDTMSPEQARAFRTTLERLALEKRNEQLAQALAGASSAQGGGNAP